MAGITISIDDVVVPDAKTDLIDEALGEVEKFGISMLTIITDGERYNKIIDVWTHATSSVSRAVQEPSAEEGFNSVYIMKDSALA